MAEKPTYDELAQTVRQLEAADMERGKIESLLRETEQALLKSEERFKLAMQASRDGLWDWDIETNAVYYSPGYASMLGYPSTEVPPHVDAWLDLIHPEDKATAYGANLDCIENRCDRFEAEFRMQASGGDWRWILARGKAASRDGNGRATRLVGTHTDITHRKAAEKSIRDSEDYMRSIFKAAPTGIGVVRDRVFVQVNDTFCEMLGYSRGELIGQSSRMIYPSEAVFEKAGKDKYKQIGTYGTGSVETRFKRKDDGILNILLSSTPIDVKDLSGGVTFTALDITAMKKAELSLKASELKYRTMMEALKDPVYICSQDFTVQYMNPAMLAQVGYDATGESCYKALYGFEEQCPWCQHDKITQAGHLEQDVVSPKDKRSYNISASVFTNADGSLSKIFVFRDKTEFINLQTQLQQAQKMEAIGNLAGGIAHDFNNILFPIIGLSEMLLDDFPSDSPEYESAQEIYAAGKRGGDLVRQILAFSRQSEEKMMPVRVHLILNEVLKLCRSTIPSNIEFVHNIQRSCGRVMANPTQIHQIAMNLITNAYHAVEDADGKIRVELEEVELGLEDVAGNSILPGRYARMHIRDNGSGIDPVVLDKIFDPYFTTKAQGKGTGLGLAVAYGIVKAHKGEILVESTLGEGTIVNVYLPIVEKPDQPEAISKTEDLPTGSERILFVDDEAVVAQLGKRILERLGYHVTCHTSSVEALEIFRATPDMFDLVVTDMAMPNMTGGHLAQKMLSIRPNLPILICTGFSEYLDEKRARAMGIKGFLMKPVVKSKMAKMVRRVLDASAST